MTYAVNQTAVKVIASSIVENQECIEVEFLSPLHYFQTEEKTENKQELYCSKNEVKIVEAENGSSSDENALECIFVDKDGLGSTTIPGSYSTFKSEYRDSENSNILDNQASSSSSLSTDSSIARESDAPETTIRSAPPVRLEDIAKVIVLDHSTCDLNEINREAYAALGDESTLTPDQTIDLPSAPQTKCLMKESPSSDVTISAIACDDLLNEKDADLNQNEHTLYRTGEKGVTKAMNKKKSEERIELRSSHIDYQLQVEVQSPNDTSFVNAMFEYMNITDSPSQDESIIGELDDVSSAGEISEDDNCHMYQSQENNSTLNKEQQRIETKEKMTKDMFDYILHAGSDDDSLMDLDSPSCDEIDTMHYQC